MKMYVTTEEDKIVLHNTANYPYENIALTHDELEQLAAYYQREKDEKEMAEYLQSAIDIPDSAEISATLAQKYLKDAGLFDQLVTETNRLQDDLGYDFLTSVGKASEKLEKDRDVKEWYGITRSIAERFANEFIADRNPCHWTGNPEELDSLELEMLAEKYPSIKDEHQPLAYRMAMALFHMRSDKHICTIFDIPFYSYGDAALCVYELVNTKKQ